MKGLMLHCGAHAVEREQVAGVNTPQRTETWTPISHEYLIDEVSRTLNASRMSIAEESHALTRDGQRYFGLFRIESQDLANKDYSTVMGLRNAHDKCFPAAIAFGASGFVCDNLSFCGETQLGRRHTKNIFRDLPQVISRTIGQLADKWSFQDKRFDAYRNTDISDKEACYLVRGAYRAGACKKTDAMDILDQWENPNHPEFEDRNAWSLFNAFTEELKGNLIALPKRTQALHGLLDGHCGVLSADELPATNVINN